MRKAVFAVIISCVAIAGTVYGAPEIYVEEPTYNFGSILEGFAVTHAFKIENTGDEVLNILEVSASCRCTASELATERLAPGESVELNVLVDTAGFGGKTITKSIYVYVNDPTYADAFTSNLPRYTLRVKGDVIRMQDYHLSASDMNYLFTFLVDLRDPAAYEEAHLISAINISYDQLSESLDLLPVDAFIILYDQDGQASEQAARELDGLGYSTVFYVLGGLDEWTRWYDTFFLETTTATIAVPDTERTNRLECPDNQAEDFDALCSDTADLQSLIYLLVDLRDPVAYAEGHLLGAINIPYTEISRQLGTLPKDVLIILYDSANEQSDAVAQMMATAGFREVRSLLGGLTEWGRQFGERFITASPE